jgi:hypothetical protein
MQTSAMPEPQTSRSLVVVDAHVHIHPSYTIARVFEAAAGHLRRAARQAGEGHGFAALLLLTEGHDQDSFQRLRGIPEIPRGAGRPPWRLRTTDEAESLAVEAAEDCIAVVAGRQIVTAEGIEVLALATDRRFAEGASLGATVEAVQRAGAVAVLPWGFGKWLGRRGAVVRGYLEGKAPTGLCLGDNGGRPSFWPRPALFAWADAAGVPILPGSDPLPLPGEEGRVGSRGFTVRAEIDPERPGAELRRLVASPGFAPRPYGSGESAGRFLRNQLAMQWRKRARPGA